MTVWKRLIRTKLHVEPTGIYIVFILKRMSMPTVLFQLFWQVNSVIHFKSIFVWVWYSQCVHQNVILWIRSSYWEIFKLSLYYFFAEGSAHHLFLYSSDMFYVSSKILKCACELPDCFHCLYMFFPLFLTWKRFL